MNEKISIFKSLTNINEPHQISLESALSRIENGSSRKQVEYIRQLYESGENSLKVSEAKKLLPCVTFSGTFSKRSDSHLLEHSGFIVLDFDKVSDVKQYKELVSGNKYIFACWISPTGNGVKALVRISDPSKHKEHFESILDTFPDLDKSGGNLSRVCFESYDPDIYINKDAKVFDIIKSHNINEIRIQNKLSDNNIFAKLIIWKDKREQFVDGNRNRYIFTLAGACCRYGMTRDMCEAEVRNYFSFSDSFGEKEAITAVRSAYRANQHLFATAEFTRENNLITTSTRTEVIIEVETKIVDNEERISDIIYLNDISTDIYDIYRNGYPSLLGVNTPLLDKHYKPLRGDTTVITGYANYGKSTFLMWYLVMRALMYDERFALYSPESGAKRFYLGIKNMLLGKLVAYSGSYPETDPRYISPDSIRMADEWIRDHFYFVHPKEASPTPEYLESVFLKAVVLHRISGIVIDPFNQMDNDYSKAGGRDLYVSRVMSSLNRFAQNNNIFCFIVAHPRTPSNRGDNQNFPMPDAHSISDGSMYVNKAHHVLIFHRPDRETHPDLDTCQLRIAKIKDMPTQGRLGTIDFNYTNFRFFFDESDPLQEAIDSIL